MVRRTLRTGLSCLQLSGDLVCASQVSLRHHEPRPGQPALPASDRVGNPRPLGLSRPRDGSPQASGGRKEAGAAQDETQEAACNSPYTPGKEIAEAGEARA